MCLVMISLLTMGIACGNSVRGEPSPVQSKPTEPSKSEPTFSPKQMAYLEDARHVSQSIELGEAGRDATLLAIGKDWCRWRQSPDFGGLPERQFFDEIDIGARDGAGIRRAAESHLCPE
jgi:hypothetical protein